MKYVKTVLLFMLVLVLSSCNTTLQASLEVPELIKPIEIKYDTTKAHIGDITSSQRLDGYVMPYKTEEVSFKAENAKLKQLYVTLGQTVTKGDLIAELDVEDTYKAIEKKQQSIEKLKTSNEYTNNQKQIKLETLDLEKQDLDKQLDLYNRLKDSISAVQIDDLKNAIKLKALEIEDCKLNIAQTIDAQQLEMSLQQQALQKLRESLTDNKLYASCSGVIVYKDTLEAGDRVTPLKAIVQIADTSQLVVGYLGDDSFPSSIIEIRLNIAGKSYSGTELKENTTVIPTVAKDKTVTSAPKKIRIQNADAAIQVGQYASIELIYRQKKDLLLIPYNCLVVSDNGSYVYVLEEGKKVRRQVEIGLSNKTDVEITKGLTLEDTLYINTASEEYRKGTIAEVARGDILSYAYLKGTTMPSQSEKLNFEYDKARFTTLNVSKGTQVKAGDVIAEIELENKDLDIKTSSINITALEKEYESNKALKLKDIEDSQTQLERLQRQYQTDQLIGTYAQRDLDKELLTIELKKKAIEGLKIAYDSYIFEKEYAISQAQLSLQELKENLSKTIIKAPFDGIIAEITQIKPMQLLDKDDIVAVLASKQRPLVKVSNVNAADICYGMSVEVGIGRSKFKGKVISCPSILAPGSPLTNTAVVELQQVNDADININAAAADAKLTKKEVKEVVLVNKNAVKQYNGREFVYVLEQGMKKQRYIVTGSTDGTRFEVLSGLSVGEKVVVD